MKSTFPTFFQQLGSAWKLFAERWGVVTLLQLLTVIPAFLMLPLALTYMSAMYQGVDTTYAVATSPYTVEFLIGFFGAIFFGVLSMTAMMIVFA
ncbi:MAG: hypothetical protein ABIP54_04385, partial [Candidatus Andersenbacteria bacterium]